MIVVKYEKISQYNYSDDDIEEVLNIIDNYESDIVDYYFETEYFSEVKDMIDGKKYNISIHFVDSSFKALKNKNQNEIMMSKDLEGIYEIGEQINIELNENLQEITR